MVCLRSYPAPPPSMYSDARAVQRAPGAGTRRKTGLEPSIHLFLGPCRLDGHVFIMIQFFIIFKTYLNILNILHHIII